MKQEVCLKKNPIEWKNFIASPTCLRLGLFDDTGWLSDGFWVIVFSRPWLVQNPFPTKLSKMA